VTGRMGTRRAVVTLAVVLAVSGCCASASATAATRSHPRLRKDVASLTKRERSNFVHAVLKLKRAPSPYDRHLNYYDQFVKWHRDLYRCKPGQVELMAHGGPMFLPWHRAYVLAFENALRQVSGKRITVPYWDWASPGSTRAALALVGGDGNPDQQYVVTKGPFRKGRFRIRVNPQQKEWVNGSTRWITRHIGSFEGFAPLPQARDVAAALAGPR
jgi:tyrosinase